MPLPNIVFCGGNSSGKTTLAKWVSKYYRYNHTYLNQTRRIIQESYGGELETARVDNFKFQQDLLNHKVYWETKHKNEGFVSDRSTLDNLAYFLSFTTNISTPETLHYHDKALTHAIKTYDVIFCLSPLFDVQVDPLSPSDACNQLKIYHITKSLCYTIAANRDKKCPDIKLIDNTNLTSRKFAIMKFISEYKWWEKNE